MLTIKYRMSDGAELIEGGFATVTSNIGEFDPHSHDNNINPKTSDPVLRRTVTGHKPDGQTVTFGPYIKGDDTYSQRGIPQITPVVWVMNEAGTTVAKYDL